MNKLLKVILATLGGVDSFVYIITPVVLVSVFLDLSNINSGWKENCFLTVAFISMLFRAIKIGFIKRQ